MDTKAVSTFIRVCEATQPDEIIINGDGLDFPYISNHTRFLYEDGYLSDYTEVGEIEYFKEQFLKPLSIVVSEDTRIVYRLGNHEERITKPKRFNKDQLERIAILNKHYKATELEYMLELDAYGVEYDPTPKTKRFGIYSIVHGLSLAKNASEKNIFEYWVL